jgi:hypothetical protein
MNDLYYIERDHTVKAVPYSRDRAMSVAPVFHDDRQKALRLALSRLRMQIQMLVERADEIEGELNDVP